MSTIAITQHKMENHGNPSPFFDPKRIFQSGGARGSSNQSNSTYKKRHINDALQSNLNSPTKSSDKIVNSNIASSVHNSADSPVKLKHNIPPKEKSSATRNFQPSTALNNENTEPQRRISPDRLSGMSSFITNQLHDRKTNNIEQLTNVFHGGSVGGPDRHSSETFSPNLSHGNVIDRLYSAAGQRLNMEQLWCRLSDFKNKTGSRLLKISRTVMSLLREMLHISFNISKLILGILLLLVLYGTSFCWSLMVYLTRGVYHLVTEGSWAGRPDSVPEWKEKLEGLFKKKSLRENITLPSLGHEAVQRILLSKNKDPYTILGLRRDCSIEEIKRYYRRQAVLVHPDKNPDPKAEDAFKVLSQAFEKIGEVESRSRYDALNPEIDMNESDLKEFSNFMTRLHNLMADAVEMIGCSRCGGKHRRHLVDRLLSEARYCNSCDKWHGASEGDVWAESSYIGIRWVYYACMEGEVYDITEWAKCQGPDNLRVQSNSHFVTCHIRTGSRANNQRPRASDIDELFTNLMKQAYGEGDDFDGSGATKPGGRAAAPRTKRQEKKRSKKRRK